jgi:hypothetical protein
MDDLLSRIEELEKENVETSNVLYSILNRIELLENDYVLRSDKFREGNGTLCE